MRWLLYLYPVVWRRRYEDEMLDIFEDTSITAGTVADLVFGAVDAHLHYAARSKEAIRMARRRFVLASLGALALVAVIKFLPPYSSGVSSVSSSASFILLGKAEGGRALSIHHLSCAGQVPSTLTVKRGTLLAITCPMGVRVSSTTHALINVGRSSHGQTLYVLAYKTGHGTIQLDRFTVTVTVRH